MTHYLIVDEPLFTFSSLILLGFGNLGLFFYTPFNNNALLSSAGICPSHLSHYTKYITNTSTDCFRQHQNACFSNLVAYISRKFELDILSMG